MKISNPLEDTLIQSRTRFSLSRFLRSSHGVGMIEFAIALPVLLVLFAGVIELTRFVLANQKVDKSASSLADFLGQQDSPATFDINVLDNAFDQLLSPFDTAQSGFTVTGVALDANKQPRILWQKSRGAVQASKVGTVGAVAQINGIQLQEGEQAIAAEVFYKHALIIAGAPDIAAALDFDGKDIYKLAISLQRVPAAPPMGAAQNMPKLYGCCGEYCEEGDKLDPTDTDFLPWCACLDIPQRCEYPPGHPNYDSEEAQRRRLWHSYYGCPYNGVCATPPPPNPCVATGTCPPAPPCAPANSCRCNPAFCKKGGV